MTESTRNCAVIFKGELVTGSDMAAIREQLMAVFKLTPPQVERLLASSGAVLKKGLTAAQARRYQTTLQQIGLICHITDNRPPPPADREPAARLDQATVERAFAGEFAAVRINHKYLMGLFGTATLMLLLPLIYLGIIALTGYATLWHIVNNLEPATRAGNGIITGVLYLTPIVIGITLVLFLIKPIFARPAIKRLPIALDPVRHRRFFHFVECICTRVGAPKPSAIHVDGYVNASARLKHGVFSNQLVLTVGMPLIMGLNTRELAGVLAHEFGHFSQRYAMKLGQVIHDINYWFYRVVHERDCWDEAIEQWLNKNKNVYVLLTGQCTRLCIWLTRRLLHGLMLLGILVSRYMSRQMEFDADLYAARMSGSQHYQRMTLAVRLLSIAFASAHQRNMAAWNEGHVTDNLPQLTANFAATLPASIRQRLKSEISSSNSRRWDTHPSDAERIEHAAREACDGIFRLELPATLLLYDHERLNRLTTLNYYRDEGIRISETRLVTPEKILESATSRSEAHTTLDQYFNGLFQPHRVIPLHAVPGHSAASSGQLQSMVDELRQSGPDARAMAQQYTAITTRTTLLRVACAFAEAGIPFDNRTYNLPSSEKKSAEAALSKALADYHHRDAQLRHYEKMMGQRLSLALTLACDQNDADTRQQILTQWRALLGLGKVSETVAALISYGFVLEELYSLGSSDKQRSQQICRPYLRLCNREIEHIRSVLANYPLPFAGNEASNLGQLLQQWIDERCSSARNEIEICLATRQAVVDALIHLNGRISGALAIHATQAEDTAGITPLRLTSAAAGRPRPQLSTTTVDVLSR